MSDARATAFWSTPPHKDVAITQAWLDAMISIEPQSGEDFVVELNGRVIGKAGFFQFPEIGFIFHPETWGNGYAEESLRPVLDRSFSVHKLLSVEADVDPRNEACLGLLSRLGFIEVSRKTHTWQVGDQWFDSVYLRAVSP